MVGRTSRQQERWESVQRVVRAVRPMLGRCICVVNGKGGTGKTSTCVNLAATMAQGLAEAGSPKRVLAMEFDVQANLKSDLALRGKAGDDDGDSMLQAVMGTGPLAVIRDVRPNLDIVPSGDKLKRVVRLLASSSDDERTESWLNFAQAVAEIAGEYEYILLDCPPGDEELQKLAMVLARWVVIPTVFDKASRWGLELVGKLFDEVEGVNDEVEVLGILMFAFERREERQIKDETGEVVSTKEVGQRARLRNVLEGDLARGESDAPVFRAVIGNSRVAGEVCRHVGCVAFELADVVASDKWPAISKDLAVKLGGKVSVNAATAEALAADYESAAVEIFGRVRELEGAGV